jgi:DNA polymerase (family 10)
MIEQTPTNEEIADLLERVAALLEAQDASPYRTNAYRRAARTVARAAASVSEMARGEDGGQLEDLPDIGKSIGGAIREFVKRGRLGLLERLEGQVSPEDLFTTVPGIGDELAKRIHTTLHIETLEDLELAAHDGRLSTVQGLGVRRVDAIRNSVAAILASSSRRRARKIRHLAMDHHATGHPPRLVPPSVATLLAVDEEYRRKAQAGDLKTIAPRRFNPDRKPWLPILHTERESYHFHAMFSNTARAHELGKTGDWVVIFFERDGLEDQSTVVTEHHGTLDGRRVVRGREPECAEHYGRQSASAESSANAFH